MKRCILIIPYFGKFNSYFHLFLHSCRNNPDFDWLIFTDDRRNFEYPDNITVKYTTFDKIKVYIQRKFKFKIALDQPYKLCDYKIAYGDIFSEFISGYEFWGFCDTDVIFGRLNQFITDEVLDSFDKILFRGHFVLLRNSPECRTLYRTKMKGMPVDYRFAFTTDYMCHFDEHEMWQSVTRRLGIREWRKIVYADIGCNSFSFHAVQGMYGTADQIYLYDHGAIYRFYICEGVVKKDEWAYIHLQKRRMTVENVNDRNLYAIIPNRFTRIQCNTDKEFIIRHSPKRVFYMVRRIERFKEIITNIKKGAIRYRIHRRMNGGI